MHLGFITSHYAHKRFKHDGGIGTSIFNLVNALNKKGIVTSVFVYGQKEDFIVKENNSIIYSISSGRQKYFRGYLYRKQLQNFINSKIISEKIDAIEAPDWTGITAFMNLKAPLVIRFHGSDGYFCYLDERKQKVKNYFLEKIALKNAKAFIAPTKFAGDLTQKIFKLDINKITTLPYGISLSQFYNEKPEDFEKGLILYIGTIIRKKGVLELSKIINRVTKKLPFARLVLIGNDVADLQTQSNSTWQLLYDQLDEISKKKVSYLGKIPYDEVQDYIKKANICVFPTFAETLGMVTIESMAMKKPVISSNMGWVYELIEDGKSGIICNPKNHHEFSERIINLLQNDKISQQMGLEARMFVEEKFDIEKIVEKNILFYKNLIKK